MTRPDEFRQSIPDTVFAPPTSGQESDRSVGEITRQLADAAARWLEPSDVESAATGVTTAVLAAIPQAHMAGVVIGAPPARGRVLGATDAVVATLESPAFTRPGPHAMHEQRLLVVPDTAAETRWPEYAAHALDAGVAGLLCLPLSANGHELGSLNLYAPEADAFTGDDIATATVFAACASLALAQAHAQKDFARALATRDLIGQAKGVLIHRHKITGEQAFQKLVKASQHANLKLVDVAHWLVAHHTEDFAPPPADPAEPGDFATAAGIGWGS